MFQAAAGRDRRCVHLYESCIENTKYKGNGVRCDLGFGHKTTITNAVNVPQASYKLYRLVYIDFLIGIHNKSKQPPLEQELFGNESIDKHL
jgi:hypothetical protein